MRSHAMTGSTKGITLPELLVVAAVAVILMGVSMPAFLTMRENARLKGAVMHVVSDVQDARSRAIVTGWQYRLLGFNAGADSAYRNQYRLLARRSSAVPWPEQTTAPFESATQVAGLWVDLVALYHGVRLNPEEITASFWITFDGRGVPIEINGSASPLRIAGGQGASRAVLVSPVGSVRVQ